MDEASGAGAALPTVQLAAALKKYGDVTYKANVDKDSTAQTRRAVVAFDTDLLIRTCHVGSVGSYDPALDIAELTSAVIKRGEVLSSRDLLYTAIDNIARLHGWQPRKDKNTICCNRAGSAADTVSFCVGRFR